MKLLQLALALWATAFFTRYQVNSIVVVLAVWLWFVSSRKYAIAYVVLALVVTLHMNQAVPPPPVSYEGKVTSVRESYVIVQVENQLVIVSGDVSAGIHDTISFRGEYANISGFENNGLFDYVKFRENQHIYYQLYATSFTVVKQSSSLPAMWYRFVNRQKNDEFRQLAQRFLYRMEKEDEYEFVSFLTSSGMHLSILVGWIERILGLFLTQGPLSFAVLLFPLLYGMSFGYSLAVVRLVLNRCLGLTSLSAKHRLACLIMILLLMDPHHGFSLSFVIPVTLRLTLLFRPRWLPAFIYQSLAMFPIILHINFSFTVFQAIFFSLLREIFALLHLLCMMALFLPILQVPLLQLYDLITAMMENNHAVLSFGIVMKVSLMFCIMWIGAVCALASRHRQAFIAMMLLLAIQYASIWLVPWTEITFLDVGQGDATLVSLPFSSGHILIDTGGHVSLDVAEMVLIPFLKKKGIRSVDLVILTHDDVDHSGAFSSLSKKIEIKQVISGKQKDHDEHGIVRLMVRRQSFLLLHQDHVYEDGNDNSLIVFASFGKRSLLFTGDAGQNIERALMRRYEHLEADILHIGHHGSKTSTSKDFLLHVNPQLVVISAGKNNRYGHPHPEVTSMIAQQGIPIVSTKEHGSVSLFLWDLFSLVRTYASGFAIIEAVIS